MLRSYLTIAWRNLSRHPFLATLNLLGLTVGVACCTLFCLYAFNELSFDTLHRNGSTIFRVYEWDTPVADHPASAKPYTASPFGPSAKQELPGVASFTRFLDNWGGQSFIKTERAVFRDDVSYADASFFSIFSFPLLQGDPSTALSGLNAVVLTESAAKKAFGMTDVIGRPIQIKVDTAFKTFIVSAVAKDLPSNSTIQFEILANLAYFESTDAGHKGINNWNRIAYQTWLQLSPGSSLPHTPGILANFHKKHFGLQPLRDVHTNTVIDGDAVDLSTIWTLLGIAIGILVIACINFTTLSIGRSASRSKEVGIRKVAGGVRSALILQFLTESFLFAAVAAVAGLLLARILLPWFNIFSGGTLSFSLLPAWEWIAFLLLLTLSVGWMAGSYPALLLSRFKPVDVLRSRVRLGGSNFFTKGLVTFQFVLSFGFILATVVILRQLHYLHVRNTGFDKENIVDIEASGIAGPQRVYQLFKQELRSYPGISGISSAEMGLGEGTGSRQLQFHYNGVDKQVFDYPVDFDYTRLLGIQLIAGRALDANTVADTSTSVVINEALMRDFGWTDNNAVGQRLTGFNGRTGADAPMVIGVIRDFNYQDLHQDIKPQLFEHFLPYTPSHFFVRLRPGDPAPTLAALQATWKKLVPDYPFRYNFLDENFARFYQSESRWSSIVGWAGSISLFLAVLGILGLSTLAIIHRTKEIGIRRIFGASGLTIARLLSTNFLRLLFLAFLLAAPLAWYFTNNWLRSFAYHITPEWWLLAATGFLLAAIALLPIILLVTRLNHSNPAKALQTDQ